MTEDCEMKIDMKKIVLATHNAGKVREFAQIIKRHEIEVLSLSDIGYEDEIEENGATFEENALIKARQIAKQFKTAVVADDSGLEVDALNKEPGVYSARYAGPNRSDEENMDKVLEGLKNVPANERTAQFVCALAFIDETGKETVVRGTCEGQILHEKRGDEGFGYDPIFYLPQLDKTMAQLAKAEKNALSHRANAFKQLELIIEV